MALGHRILVPLDGSPLGEWALPVAATVARHSEGTLHLVGVHAPWLLTEMPPGADVRVGEAERAARVALERYLDRTAASLEKEHGIGVDVEVREGAVDGELLEACDELKCDLIAMSTHGRGGFDRVWLGSVADRVVRRAEVPVLLLSARGRDDVDDDDALPPPAPDIRTVIVPLDGSEFSARALTPATALGDAFSADYILFRAVRPAAAIGAASVATSERLLLELNEAERSRARREAEEEAGRLRDGGYTVSVVVAEDDPVAAMLRLARATPGSVIVMTTHGRGGLRRAILGSVADKVVRASTRPVMVVRPPEE